VRISHYLSKISVITGIGHQRDESLADLVADAYAHTPTAAAEQVVPELTSLYAEHRERLQALQRAANDQINTVQNHLGRLQNRLQRLPLERQIQQQQQLIVWQKQQLIQATQNRLQNASQYNKFLQEKLATLDPKAVLKRGYAVVRTEKGAIARSSSELAKEQELLVQLGTGRIKVKVTEIFDK
jgi:exodeoxyribonuclease VII large subunit